MAQGTSLMASRDIADIPNTLERRATLIVEMIADRAQHVVDALDEPPPGTSEPDSEQVRAMWSFTPFGTRAEAAFWTIHDLALEKLMGEIAQQAASMSADQKMQMIRQAHQQAEITAMQRTYPHRAQLIELGITTPERSVQLAEKAARLVDQHGKRNPDTLPHEQGMPAPAEAPAY
jgi:hypothetical protein